MTADLADVLAGRIGRLGSLRFDDFVEAALYDDAGGFFTTGGGAGRSGGDFITSPEVGPLFGAVLSRFLDARWDELDRPDPFVVVEAGAGRGTLAVAVLAATPRCAAALRYVLVERSGELRRRQAEHLPLVHPFEVLGPDGDADLERVGPAAGNGPLVCSLTELPSQPVDGVVVANELLDNLPFRLLERGDEGWRELRVAVEAGRFVELAVPADPEVSTAAEALAPDAPVGARIPLQAAAGEWLRRARSVLRSGSVLVLDYAASTPELATRPQHEWLRTYRGHDRGDPPLHAVGTQDITCEVAVDQVSRAVPLHDEISQADWLRRWGIEGLVAEGRRIWGERAGLGDLEALRARSRVAEAEALLDPTGLGGFRVLEVRAR